MAEPSPVANRAEREVDYASVRARIDDADVFLFRGTELLSRVIEAASHARYSHAAIAANWGERKMILQAELMGGVQAVPLSVVVGTYAGRVDWYKLTPEARAEVDVAALMAEARADLGLTYATSDLLRVAAHDLFGAGLPHDCDNPHALFCSQYVERCFRRGGLRLSNASDVGTSPGAIATSSALAYVATIRHDPSVVPKRTADAVAP